MLDFVVLRLNDFFEFIEFFGEGNVDCGWAAVVGLHDKLHEFFFFIREGGVGVEGLFLSNF